MRLMHSVLLQNYRKAVSLRLMVSPIPMDVLEVTGLLRSSWRRTVLMAFDVRAVALLGLLDLDPSIANSEPPTGIPESVEQLDHWQVEHFQEVAVWRCRCTRSNPIVVPQSLMQRVRLPNDLLRACEVCRDEYEAARGKSGLLRAWLERNRTSFDRHACLLLPDDLGFCRDTERQASVSTRRFIYERFHKTQLRSCDFVRTSCNDADCINPHHLCLTSAPAQKISKQTRFVILQLDKAGVSRPTIRRLLREKYSVELSERSIRRVLTEKEQQLSSHT